MTREERFQEAVDIFVLSRLEEHMRVLGDHWIWHGSFNSTSGLPIFAVPYARPVRWIQVRRWLYDRQIRKLAKNERALPNCEIENCVKPQHTEIVTHSEMIRRSWHKNKAV